MFNMNFTKDLVLCEIIERHEGKVLLLLIFFYCRIIIQNDSHGVCTNECIPIITLLIPITYIGHFLHLNSVDTENDACVFRGYRLIS